MATLTTSPYLRTFNFFCATSLVIFAIAIIALYSETRKLAHKYPADEATEWVRPHNVFYWPTYNISYSPDHLILGAGIVSLITGMAGLALSFAYTETLAKFETVLGLASLGTGLGALIHGMNMHGKAPAIEHGTHWLYGGNVWTLETWTCGLKGLLVVDSEIKDYGVMCRDSKAARFMTVPLFLLSFFFLITIFQFYSERKMKERNAENAETSTVDAPSKYTENAERAST